MQKEEKEEIEFMQKLDIARLSRAAGLIEKVLKNIDSRDSVSTGKLITSGENRYGIATKLNSMRSDLKSICIILGKVIK